MDDSTPTDETAAIPVVIGIAAIGECVLWAKGLTRSGYGRREINGRKVYVHRLAWAEIHGDPGAFKVCHRCDVRHCINVEHLFLGTQADNIADMIAKGREAFRKGERNGRAKLTENHVREIRASTETCAAIGRRLGVSRVTVSFIRLRKTWEHLP